MNEPTPAEAIANSHGCTAGMRREELLLVNYPVILIYFIKSSCVTKPSLRSLACRQIGPAMYREQKAGAMIGARCRR